MPYATTLPVSPCCARRTRPPSRAIPGTSACPRSGIGTPPHLRDRIDALDRWLRPAVNEGVDAAARGSRSARARLLEAFEQVDAHLSRAGHLVGDVLTEATSGCGSTLVRYDAGPNARRTVNPGLHVFPHLWRYAHRLHELAAFRDTTDFAAFTAPGAEVRW